MSKGLPSRKAIAATEATITASLSNAGQIRDLLVAFGAATDSAPGLASELLHALRRIFTKLFHDGVMSGSGMKTTGGKSKGKSDATAQQAAAEALAAWLREQYKAFQTVLFRCLLGSADDSEGGHDRRELAVAALSTFAHFTAHACSIRTQRKAGGKYMCTETIDWLLRRLLTCYAKDELPPQYRGGASSEAAPAGAAAVPPPADLHAVREGALPASAAASLDRALEAFRSQYCDDYDDVRLQACRAITAAAKDKMSQLRSAGSSGAGSASSSSSSSDPLALCPAPVFLRRAAGLLLDIALPPDEDAWAEAEHESLVADQWRPVLPELYKDSGKAGLDGDDDDSDDDSDAAGPGAKRVKLYRGDDDSDDSDDDKKPSGKGKAKGNGKAAAAAGGAGAAASAGTGGKNGKRPRPSGPAAAVSDFGDEEGSSSAVLPMGSAGGAAAKRAGGKKKAPPAAAALPRPVAGFAGDDDDDDLDLDAIKLDDVAPAGGAGGAGAGAAGSAAAAAAEKPSTTPRYLKLSEQRRAYIDAWLALLQLGGTLVPGSAGAAAAAAAAGAGSGAVATALPPDVLRRVLLALPTRLLPLMPGRQPLLLSDFLTACLDAGGVVSVLALESLFLLVRSHGLEYPRLYARTYALLTPEAVHARHRARFFKLLDMLLGSAALPAYLVAAFAKKALRLALTAATPYALFAIPFAFNCLKRHPACAPLLHKEAPVGGAGAGATAWPLRADPFDPEAADPADARALESSLWEVTALATHYHAPTSYLARAFLKGPDPLARAEYDIAGEYAAQSSAALVAAELDKTVRRQGVTSAVEVPFHYALEEGAPALDELCSW